MGIFKKNRRYKRNDDYIIGMGISSETKKAIAAVAFFALAGISFLSYFELAGSLGIFLDKYLSLAFGSVRWYIPVIFAVLGFFLMQKDGQSTAGSILGLLLLVLSFNGTVELVGHSYDMIESARLGIGGGYVGLAFAYPIIKLTGFWAGLLILLALDIISILIIFNATLHDLSRPITVARSWQERFSEYILRIRVRRAQKIKERYFEENNENPAPLKTDTEVLKAPEFITKEIKKPDDEKKDDADEKTQENNQFSAAVNKFHSTKINLPLEFLNSAIGKPTSGDIKANQLIIQKTLQNFSIPVEMGEVNVGPTVTQYTLKPAEGIKLSKITTLHNDLALSLAVHPIRIEAPIPGRSLVGIEVPNQTKATVFLKEILQSNHFKNRKSHLYLGIGKDVKGNSFLADVARMPHLLIAGSTGSGKSVCIKSIIVSLLYQNNPGQLKFIMVDPKRVELPIYNGIPHLLTPVITEVEKTVNALKWAITEMERRFDILSQVHARDLETYISQGNDDLPYIIIIIDELADLMAARGPEVEAAIIRLAQMSRAVGIHLIVATQRPSVDVITGLIKANITSRVAFSVASLVDSRTILDMSGAEKLLGRGDMLFITSELGKPKRLQGAFVSDAEIKKIVDFLKEKAEPEYLDEIVEKQRSISGFSGDYGDDGDELLNEAKEIIVQAGKASASLLQRRLRVGYARAARILDLLEEQGFIGPGDGAKPREILYSGSSRDTEEE
ncbi:DNA translocase FtsK [Candidatus Parcubacteria bacterium]|nr:MAG: DNA translocase FtsK [Candidatus Parcubacteria bacterium]